MISQDVFHVAGHSRLRVLDALEAEADGLDKVVHGCGCGMSPITAWSNAVDGIGPVLAAGATSPASPTPTGSARGSA